MSFKLTRRDLISFTVGSSAALIASYTGILAPLFKSEVPIKRPDGSKLTVFLHIPKTGGTTLRTHLMKNVPPSRQKIPDTPDFAYAIKNNYSQAVNELDFLFIRGHFKLEWDAFLDKYPEHTQCVTMLRSPVKRFRSSYIYQTTHWNLENTYEEYLANLNLKNLKDVAEIVSRDARKAQNRGEKVPSLAIELNNAMTRRLCGYGLNMPFGSVNRQMLEDAKTNLRERFIVVGITGEYNKFLYLLTQKFGWKINPSVRLNTSKRKIPITEEDRAAIIDLNRYDQELYEFGNDLFEKQWGALTSQQQQDYVRFLSSAR